MRSTMAGNSPSPINISRPSPQRDRNDTAALCRGARQPGTATVEPEQFQRRARGCWHRPRPRPRSNDPVLQRLIRNFRAINQLNQRNAEAALTELAKPVAADRFDRGRGAAQRTDHPAAGGRDQSRQHRLQAGQYRQWPAPGRTRGGARCAGAAIVGHRASPHRQAGPGAQRSGQGAGQVAKVRDGKLTSAGWLVADIDVERALVAEAAGDSGSAIGAYDAAIALLAQGLSRIRRCCWPRGRGRRVFWPGEATSPAARTLFARSGRPECVDPRQRNCAARPADTLFRNACPRRIRRLAALMFRAAQALARPGVAQTQAVLARQLSEGDGEASALFRLAVARTRKSPAPKAS